MSKNYIGYIGNRRLNNVHRYLDYRIDSAKNHQVWHIKLPCDPQEYIEHLREIYHQIPACIERANVSRKHINEAGLVKLDGRIGKALDRRGVAQHVGAENLYVDFWCTNDRHNPGYFTVIPQYYWFSPKWLVDCAGKGNRSKLYKRFDGLKELDPSEAKSHVESEVGLLLLGDLP